MTTITGKVVLLHSNELPGREHDKKDCICCPGFPSHVYGINFELPPYESHFPEHFGRKLDYWLQSSFDFKKLEGKRIRITAELIDD